MTPEIQEKLERAERFSKDCRESETKDIIRTKFSMEIDGVQYTKRTIDHCTKVEVVPLSMFRHAVY